MHINEVSKVYIIGSVADKLLKDIESYKNKVVTVKTAKNIFKEINCYSYSIEPMDY